MLPVVLGLLSVLTTAASLYSQADAMDAYNEAIVADTEQRYLQLLEEQKQSNDEAAYKTFERTREALRQEAQAKVSGAESGALGNTFTRLLTEVDMDEMIDVAAIEHERQNTEDATELGMTAAQIKAENSMQSMYGFISGLSIISAGVGGYMSGTSSSGGSGGSGGYQFHYGGR